VIDVLWRARTEPLEPVAVAATGSAAHELARRMLNRSDEELKRVRGVSWPDGLAFEGALNDLPWADGALFLGHDRRAPKLLLPCAIEPNVPLDLWARAFERGLEREMSAPILVMPSVQVVVSMAEARGVERAKLEAWLLSALDQVV